MTSSTSQSRTELSSHLTSASREPGLGPAFSQGPHPLQHWGQEGVSALSRATVRSRRLSAILGLASLPPQQYLPRSQGLRSPPTCPEPSPSAAWRGGGVPCEGQVFPPVVSNSGYPLPVSLPCPGPALMMRIEAPVSPVRGEQAAES